MFSVFWKKVFSLIRLPLEWKSLVIRAYKAHWTVLHSHSYPMNVAAQNITQGQMLPYCSWYLELNLRVFCCSLSHWMGFFWKCHSLGSVSVTCLQIDVSAALGSCSGHVWKCLAVVGIAEWALEVFEPALLDFCFKGRFILYGVCFMALACMVHQLIFMFRTNLTKENPNKQLQNKAGFYCILLAVRSELTSGACGTSLDDFLIFLVFFKG